MKHIESFSQFNEEFIWKRKAKKSRVSEESKMATKEIKSKIEESLSEFKEETSAEITIGRDFKIIDDKIVIEIKIPKSMSKEDVITLYSEKMSRIFDVLFDEHGFEFCQSPNKPPHKYHEIGFSLDEKSTTIEFSLKNPHRKSFI